MAVMLPHRAFEVCARGRDLLRIEDAALAQGTRDCHAAGTAMNRALRLTARVSLLAWSAVHSPMAAPSLEGRCCNDQLNPRHVVEMRKPRRVLLWRHSAGKYSCQEEGYSAATTSWLKESFLRPGASRLSAARMTDRSTTAMIWLRLDGSKSISTVSPVSIATVTHGKTG